MGGHGGSTGSGAMPLGARKAELRRRLRRERSLIPAPEREAIDARIAARVASLPQWREAPVVLSYASIGAEVGTRALIAAALGEGRTVAVPLSVPGTRDMEWYAIGAVDELVASRFGVPEPVADQARRVDPCGPDGAAAVALVPGLVFDLRGDRLGYGGGFYDTFLARFPGLSVGLARDAQTVDRLDVVDVHDVPVRVVVTQSRTLRPGRD